MTEWTLPKKTFVDRKQTQFGVYVHVPYCRVRCGYCDFNTYTATELRGTTQQQYPAEAIEEMKYAAREMASAGMPKNPASTVFFGGGTPTLLPVSDLALMLDGIRESWGLAENAEVSVEANPDSVDETYIFGLKKAGFTRVSVGMQSAVPRVLAALDRTHNPKNVRQVVGWAKDAGMQVSLDLIYGAPGETIADWQLSLETALEYDPHHISAYALIVEEGTKLARQIRKGELQAPSDDLQADMYELADEMLQNAGYSWYEISNWAKEEQFVSRHNLAYWQNTDWWGVGPGAHSHIDGFRWWNVKHPAAYAARIAGGSSPAHESENLDENAQKLEEILLRSRIKSGIEIAALPAPAKANVAALIAEELIDPKQALRGQIVLTLRGRLLADAVVHALTAGL